ncbi:MAG: hypothetical protein ACM3O7_01900 [Acidobacteriota bacterium]
MRDDTPDPQHCFRCGRDLGPRLEWQKMITEQGPICYACFNLAMAEERRDGEEER